MRTLPINLFTGFVGTRLGSYLSSGTYAGNIYGFIGGYLAGEVAQYLSQYVDDSDLRIRIKLAATITVGLTTNVLGANDSMMAVAIVATMLVVDALIPPPAPPTLPVIHTDIYGNGQQPPNNPNVNNTHAQGFRLA